MSSAPTLRPSARLPVAAERARRRNGICSCWAADPDHCPGCGICPDLDGHFDDACPYRLADEGGDSA